MTSLWGRVNIKSWSSVFCCLWLLSFQRQVNGSSLSPLYPLKILCNYTFLPEGQIQIVKGRGSHDDVDCGRCKFPFAYKGKLYSSCAVSAQGTDQEFTFCATEVSGRGSQYPQPTAFQDCRDSKTGIQHFCQTGTKGFMFYVLSISTLRQFRKTFLNHYQLAGFA